MHEGLDDSSVSAALALLVGVAIDRAGGWIPFSRFMALALYAPKLGYYASGRTIVGRMPGSGSDFVTAPELSPLFGRMLARQLAQALEATGSDELWEFGAGSGALTVELLSSLGDRVRRYSIVELSAPLRERQREATRGFGDRVRWLDALPGSMSGVVVANEVLDAMPVDLLHFDGDAWLARGVARGAGESFAWADRPTSARPPVDAAFPAGSTIELHAQAQAFVATLADRLERGAIFFFDYGFPEREYYHPQRSGGTLMCHRAHRADTDPLVDVGLKDITSHLDFSALAVAGQDAGLDVIGYTSQARFLLNCGLGELLAEAGPAARSDALKLVHEHEMGELFKVLAFAKGATFTPIGFAGGDRRHRL
ncbi:MAG: SAM-dependent methyltransferase [Pseudomonadota bacterium]|nr:SAM-dependent methyltransferase [Pseudomonadota bacterium]